MFWTLVGASVLQVLWGVTALLAVLLGRIGQALNRLSSGEALPSDLAAASCDVQPDLFAGHSLRTLIPTWRTS
jgi:hypothetical protein